MIGSTMLTYALYTGLLKQANFKQNEVALFKDIEVQSIEDPKRSLQIQTRLETMESIKRSPKYSWTFTHVSSGLGQEFADKQNWNLRFRVFAQDAQTIDGLGHDATRMLMRLWDYNLSRLSVHQKNYPYIDVYLCPGGDSPGGQHVLGHDEDDQDANRNPRSVSMIYIFQIAGLTERLERVRELAHEYGHATYPAVGIYGDPEDWANGYAAERIFIKWLYEDLKSKKLESADMMGATEGELAAYLAAKVDPLVKKMGTAGPNLKVLGEANRAAFDEYLALNSYAEAILPRAAFARAVTLGASSDGAVVFAKGIVDAAAERMELPITIPQSLKGQPMWVPLGKGKVRGAKLVERRGDWAKIQPTSATVIIDNPPVE